MNRDVIEFAKGGGPALPEQCPHCKSSNIGHGYGFAGGGCGPYMFCDDCGTVFGKVEDVKGDAE